MLSLHGDDEMRELAVAEEHIGNVHSLFPDRTKPFGFGIVLPCQVVGARIGNMIALCVEDAQVEKGP